ncbi:MAG: hypothetical protein QNJ69_04040 [Gammaproteobacteria bacterium]|nr:hypothetical protein [Gammaproteobacteria bacterium]
MITKPERNLLRSVIGSLLMLALLIPPLVDANTVRIYNLTADDWARPRSGAMIPQLEPVRLAVAYWETGSDALILLSHPGEDSGELWASELKDWLISLGVPADYIRLSPGLQVEDEIQIMVGSRQDLAR